MRIVIETIPEDGVNIDVQLDQGWAASVASTVLEATPETLEGSLLVSSRARMVEVRGEVTASGPRVCERCGESTTLTLNADVDLDYVPAGDQPSGHAEIHLAPGDLDVGWYHEGALDMADVLSEALALEMPARIVCADTNTCDQRVASLLETANRTSGAADDGPFAALRQLT